ncbi:MAG: citrate synthase [Dehalococcoidia bacterium]
MDSLLSTADAAARLGVKRETLYAYVSRGLLTAHPLPGRRGSWFDPVELDALAQRAREPGERRPDFRITSAITLVERGRYWYRGVAPDALANALSFEGAAEWLWSGTRPEGPVAWPVDARGAERARAALALVPPHAAPTDRVRIAMSVIGAMDPLRTDLRPAGAAATARRLVATTVAALARRDCGPIAAQVASMLTRRRLPAPAIDALDRTLVVMADHELAASTLAVRVAAAFRADPYAAVGAGLGALSGTLHGAASRRIETLLVEIGRGLTPVEAAARLLEGDRGIPGFGHPLYPDGDPRVGLLLPLARRLGSTEAAEALLAIAARQGAPPPNVDFALAALTHALGLGPGAGEMLFTIGRLAGWLAHALEEYEARTDFRLRAVYTGPRPS